jgi:hypothetical protein
MPYRLLIDKEKRRVFICSLSTPRKCAGSSALLERPPIAVGWQGLVAAGIRHKDFYFIQ